jgi:hypothetical protein
MSAATAVSRIIAARHVSGGLHGGFRAPTSVILSWSIKAEDGCAGITSVSEQIGRCIPVKGWIKTTRSMAEKRVAVKWQPEQRMVMRRSYGAAYGGWGCSLEAGVCWHPFARRRFVAAVSPSVPSILAIRWRLASGPF